MAELAYATVSKTVPVRVRIPPRLLMETKPQLTVGSLFAGIGGFDLGFEREGFRVAWQCEIDTNAQRILRHRFPNVELHADIRKLDAAKLHRVDVICGGFPCQDLSTGGKRAGLNGERSSLFYDAMRIVRTVRPRVVVLENVPGLLTSNNGNDFASVLREMGNGWNCSSIGWRVLDSQHFGVAQRRRRIFIVGSVADGYAEQILDFSACGKRDNSARVKTCGNTNIVARSVGSRGQSLIPYSPHGDYRYRNYDKSATLRGRENQLNGGAHLVVGVDLYNHTITGDTAATLTAAAGGTNTSGPKVIQNGFVRRLTPVECERLQGFPDDWTNIGIGNRPMADGPRYKACGNAVTVNVAQWLARQCSVVLSGGNVENARIPSNAP